MSWLDRVMVGVFPAKLGEGLREIGVWLFNVVGLEKENCCPSWAELKSFGILRLLSWWFAIVDLSGF